MEIICACGKTKKIVSPGEDTRTGCECSKFVINSVDINEEVSAYRWNHTYQENCGYGLKPFIEIEAAYTVYEDLGMNLLSCGKNGMERLREKVKDYSHNELYEEISKKAVGYANGYCSIFCSCRLIEPEKLEGEDREHFIKACERELERYYWAVYYGHI